MLRQKPLLPQQQAQKLKNKMLLQLNFLLALLLVQGCNEQVEKKSIYSKQSKTQDLTVHGEYRFVDEKMNVYLNVQNNGRDTLLLNVWKWVVDPANFELKHSDKMVENTIWDKQSQKHSSDHLMLKIDKAPTLLMLYPSQETSLKICFAYDSAATSILRNKDSLLLELRYWSLASVRNLENIAIIRGNEQTSFYLVPGEYYAENEFGVRRFYLQNEKDEQVPIGLASLILSVPQKILVQLQKQ